MVCYHLRLHISPPGLFFERSSVYYKKRREEENEERYKHGIGI